MIDPLARPVYAFLFGSVTLVLIWRWASGFTFGSSAYFSLYLMLGLMLLGALMARRYGSNRTAECLEAISIVPMIGAVTIVATVLVTRHALPFADAQLIAADNLMGFDWRGLYAVYSAHPALVKASTFSYAALWWETPLVPVLVFWSGQRVRGWEFLTAWSVAATITVAIYPFFTALGPHITFGIQPGDPVAGGFRFPWAYGPTIEAVRSGRITELAQASMGLVSFPSFHAAAAVLFAWAGWGLRRLRYPLLAINLAMIGATVVTGSHYLIDVVGGLAMAAVAIWLGVRIVRWAEPTGSSSD